MCAAQLQQLYTLVYKGGQADTRIRHVGVGVHKCPARAGGTEALYGRCTPQQVSITPDHTEQSDMQPVTQGGPKACQHHTQSHSDSHMHITCKNAELPQSDEVLEQAWRKLRKTCMEAAL